MAAVLTWLAPHRDAASPEPDPCAPSAAIAHLHANGITLTYDPAAESLTADTPHAERIMIA